MSRARRPSIARSGSQIRPVVLLSEHPRHACVTLRACATCSTLSTRASSMCTYCTSTLSLHRAAASPASVARREPSPRYDLTVARSDAPYARHAEASRNVDAFDTFGHRPELCRSLSDFGPSTDSDLAHESSCGAWPRSGDTPAGERSSAPARRLRSRLAESQPKVASAEAPASARLRARASSLYSIRDRVPATSAR